MTVYPRHTPSSLGRELGIIFGFLGACLVTMAVYSLAWRGMFLSSFLVLVLALALVCRAITEVPISIPCPPSSPHTPHPHLHPHLHPHVPYSPDPLVHFY